MNMRGFTLIEVLIALFISAIVAVMAYSGLESAIKQREAVVESAKRTKQLLQFWTTLERDIAQIAPRSIRDGFDQRQPALSGGVVAEDFLSFTRAGWSNPTGQQRTEMQRVAYAFQDDTILRAIWRDIDAVAQSEPQSLILLSGVKDINVMFLKTGEGSRDDGLGGEWLPEWNLMPQESVQTLLPAAIEITVTTEDSGEIRRVFEVVHED
jgi:general secretion pathway protein J